MNIKGNTFLVTGGSSGLGAATVAHLEEQGANLVVLDLAEPLNESKNILFQKTDITNPESVQAAVDSAISKFGSIQGAMNCAGIATVAKTVNKKQFGALEPFRQTIAVNLIGTYNVSSIAATAIALNDPTEDGERGVIINTASIAAFDGQIGQAAYSASKGGVVSMTLPMAREMAPLGIRVMAIAPGTFETPMLGRLPEKARDALKESIPFPHRLGNPKEYAHLVQHIIENSYLNAEVIRLDAALRMN